MKSLQGKMEKTGNTSGGNDLNREKIFVSAYACEPYKGSEVGVGWNWVLQMSRQFELWVLTRSNNREPIE